MCEKSVSQKPLIVKQGTLIDVSAGVNTTYSQKFQAWCNRKFETNWEVQKETMLSIAEAVREQVPVVATPQATQQPYGGGKKGKKGKGKKGEKGAGKNQEERFCFDYMVSGSCDRENCRFTHAKKSQVSETKFQELKDGVGYYKLLNKNYDQCFFADE